jgi:hypothetical protein
MVEAVYRTYYEVLPEGMPIVAAHYALVEERRVAGMKIAERYGAVGFRPSSVSGIRHLIFSGGSGDAPEGFKYEAVEAGRKIACSPHRGSALGKQIAADLKTFEGMPDDGRLASDLGYSVASAPMDGFKIYFATAARVTFPTERAFLNIPRQMGDGWEPPAHLREVPASVFMLAIETHNAEVERRESAVEAA